jgi:hypothetical protein
MFFSPITSNETKDASQIIDPQAITTIPEAASRPILVSGAHRTGTTWVGKMLSATPATAYISEPLNVLHRPGVFAAKTTRWYTYICPDNENNYLPAFQNLLRLDYGLWRELGSIHSRKDLGRFVRDAWIFGSGKLRRARPLIKDPFAIFSLGWFIERLGCQVVVTVRHPAAFVSSLKRLDWPFDLNDLLQQPYLMRDWLEPFRTEIDRALSSSTDELLQAGLLWRLVYSVVAEYSRIYHQIRIVRHEPLSLDPLHGFQELYKDLGLDFTERARQSVLASSSVENPQELSKKTVHAVQLDSRANLANWKKRLSAQEILRIRRQTEDVASLYYAEEDWL